MKTLFSFVILATLVVSAQPTPTPQPPAVSAPAAVCDPGADKVLAADWNSSQVRTLCADYAGAANGTASVWAPSTRQILPLGSEHNFLTFSSSGRLRWHTPGQTWKWLIPGANGRLRNEQKVGITLTDRWESEKLQLWLWLSGAYEVDPIPMTSADFCTSSATNPQGIGICVDGFNKAVTASRQLDFAGHLEESRLELKQFPVGAVSVGNKLFVVLATEQVYPPCNEPMCNNTPISVLPGKLVEISFGYGQAEPTQTVILDGLNITSNLDLNRVAAGNSSIYFVTGQAKILRYDPTTKKLDVYYDGGQNAFIGALAVVPGRQ